MQMAITFRWNKIQGYIFPLILKHGAKADWIGNENKCRRGLSVKLKVLL